MTREEAIDHLKTIGQYYSQDHSDPYEEYENLTKDELDAIYLAIKALEQESKWIPVSERLPEKNVEVLATTEWGAVTIAEMYSANDWFIHEGTTNAETDEIVAWQPLPKSYKPQERSGKK